jgi:hypothetical protein
VTPSTAKVHVLDEQWPTSAQALEDRGLVARLSCSEVFGWSNKKLLSGLFGVPKHERTDTGIEIMRLIMNLIPLNQICEGAEGDLATLPMMGQLSSLHVLLHERVFWSG